MHMGQTLPFEKKEYLTPVIEQVKLDNDITLLLESLPPIGPGESFQIVEDVIHFVGNSCFKK